jgi:hypothetical protein
MSDFVYKETLFIVGKIDDLNFYKETLFVVGKVDDLILFVKKPYSLLEKSMS